jgi:hypothetical protein
MPGRQGRQAGVAGSTKEFADADVASRVPVASFVVPTNIILAVK